MSAKTLDVFSVTELVVSEDRAVRDLLFAHRSSRPKASCSRSSPTFAHTGRTNSKLTDVTGQRMR